jgi:hypothetical protein
MGNLFARTLIAAALGGTVLAAPAAHARVSISVGFPAIGFSYDSGGYCDSWGCPDAFWNYPIYYCPVFYGGGWYRGPVYYRYSGGRYSYWIHGAWRRDYWSGPRPDWACVDRYGPPLGLDFYISNGFNIRDDWRYRWRNNRNDWWRHRQDWDRSHRNDTSWHSFVPQSQQNYDWSRDRNWNVDREWSKPNWNRNNRPGGNNPPTGTGTDHRNWNGGQGAGNWQGGSGASSGQMNNPPGGNNPPAGDRHQRGNWGQGGGSTSSGQPTNQPSGNNPPSDQIKGHGKGKGDQGDRHSDQNGPH